ncbi:uncharacterized protein [Rutidosis leptorrhynchoides]|uniref:uncharacterized protein n=1 Tax=Rutidosis leptorrhynchoides TaxID=125765 RepID=UPI003A98EE9D
MAKVFWVDDEEQFDHKSHIGCMSGIFHAFDNQLWHSNVKKILPHRKNEGLVKHAKRKGRYKRISDDQDPFEVLQLLDAKTSHILVDQSNKKTSSNQKKSLKARIKALVSDENDKQQDPNFVPGPKLQRTYSIHHLETNEWVDPIIFFTENVTNTPETTESRDILDMFEVDKKLFSNMLQDQSPILTKSGSFPTAYKSGGRNLIPMKLEDKVNEFFTKSKSEKRLDTKESGYMRLRRISSMNESANRYSQSFDFGVDKETILRPSKSLKLINTSFSFRISDNERNVASLALSSDKYKELNSTQDVDSLNEVIEKHEDTNALTIEEDNHHEKVQFSEDFQENNENETKTFDDKIHLKSSMRRYQEDDDFTYVKQILEHSGFIKNGFEQTWHTSNQPLDPFVFQEIESQYFHDPERFAEEINELSHRLLIFDLVDDVLFGMYERSLSYYPKALSSFCHVRRPPSGPHVVDEVWKRVSRMVNLKPDSNDSLDDIVSRDMKNDDGWMNLQLDSECVGLELEDLIFEEILEEMLSDLI